MQIIIRSCLDRNIGAFLLWWTNGGQKRKKKSSNYSHLSELLLFLCCLTRINPMQYSAIFCDKVTNISLIGKGFAIAICSKIFISGGQMVDNGLKFFVTLHRTNLSYLWQQSNGDCHHASMQMARASYICD